MLGELPVGPIVERLIEVEGRLIETPGEAPAPSRFSARETGSSSSWPPSGAAFPAAMAAADASAPATPPTRPIPVQPGESCPPGTELRNRSSEKGEEEWCQQRDADGGLRHGWYARYGEGGRPESMGEYANGLRVGVWTRFHDSGQVRAQVEFVDGLQHGWLLSFDDEGRRTRAVRFDRGAPVR